MLADAGRGPAGLQNDSGAGELDRRQTNRRARVDQHQVVNRDELAGDRAQRTGLLEITSGSIPFPNPTQAANLLVKPNDLDGGPFENLTERRVRSS